MSLTHYLHIFSHKTLKKNRALNALSLLHCTPYTENENYFWYFCCSVRWLWMYATFVAADLHSKARCKLAYGSALISRGPRCMQACSGELRSAIRSVIEQCTASHVSIVASKRRVGQNNCAFSIYILLSPEGFYLILCTTLTLAYLIYIHAKHKRR